MKKIETLEDMFGIKEGDCYCIIYKSEIFGYDVKVEGEILNFHPSQIVMKAKSGLFIIRPRDVKEMRPKNIRKGV